YAVGPFDSAGSVEADNIAVWDGNKWCGFGGTFNNSGSAAAFYHDTLYIGGGFTKIDDDSIYYIAKLSAGKTTDTCGSPVGISEVNNSDSYFSIFPNPSSDEFTITASEKGLLRITNELGQLIQSFSVDKKQLKISISRYPSGNYFLSFHTSKSLQAKKLFIQH
ncbi:MAG: T9SS type A sorting domain-containing protein, partial [Chitinophagales bacterium]